MACLVCRLCHFLDTRCSVRFFLRRFAFGLVFHYLCIGKGSAWAFPFFKFPFNLQTPQPLKGGFSTLLWVAIQPKQHCETASFAFSFGPSELLGVAVLQCRLGLVGKLMGRPGRIKRMEPDWEMGERNLHVSLFLKV